MTDGWNTREIFMRALEIKGLSDREAFLNDVCRGRPSLRERVEALLAATSQRDFLDELETSAEGLHKTSNQVDRGSPQIEDYQILRQVGEGGMGSVWEAQQLAPIRRRVAIKVIKPGMNSESVLARFEAERLAIALMDHPNIARVLDAGQTVERQPFFVMEFVTGSPITEYCDQHRLSIAERLELFNQVCRGIQHAHQKGIIHRDLKPSNVLIATIDGRPVPKIIDFGVAKAIGMRLTDHSLATQFGQVVGTLEYMSPEQAKLTDQNIDTRSDVYALGVLLYELLTGSTPFTSKELYKIGFDEVLRNIREVDPPTPSQKLSSGESSPTVAAMRQVEIGRLNRIIRGELDWIVMKALEKDRDRRYESPLSMAGDIERYLNLMPVEARPPSRWYLATKFARRNRASVFMVAMVLLTLVGGIVGTTYGMLIYRSERDAKEKALVQQRKSLEAEKVAHELESTALAAETKARAKANEAVQKAADALRTLTNDFLARQLGRNTTLTRSDRAFIEDVIKKFDEFGEFVAETKDGIKIQIEGYSSIGSLRSKLGDLEGSSQAHKRAIELSEKYLAMDPSAATRRCTLAVHRHNYALAMQRMGQFPVAEEYHLLSRDGFSRLIEEFPDTEIYQREFAVGLASYAGLLHSTKRIEESMQVIQKAIELQRRLVERNPKDPDLLSRLCNSLTILAVTWTKLENLNEAIPLMEEVVAKREAILFFRPEDPEFQEELANSEINLGQALLTDKQMEKSTMHLSRGRDISVELVSKYPAVNHYRQTYSKALANLTRVYQSNGNIELATSSIQQAIQVFLQSAVEFPTNREIDQNLSTCYGRYAAILHDQGKFNEAIPPYQSAIKHCLKRIPDESDNADFLLQLAQLEIRLGAIFTKLQKNEEASKTMGNAIVHLESIPENSRDAQMQTNLGMAYQGRAILAMAANDFSSAIPDWEKAIPLVEGKDRVTFRLRRLVCLAQVDPRSAFDQFLEWSPENLSREHEVIAARFHGILFARIDEEEKRTRSLDRAVHFLEAAVQNENQVWRATVEKMVADPIFEKLRATPEYQTWLQKHFKEGSPSLLVD